MTCTHIQEPGPIGCSHSWVALGTSHGNGWVEPTFAMVTAGIELVPSRVYMYKLFSVSYNIIHGSKNLVHRKLSLSCHCVQITSKLSHTCIDKKILQCTSRCTCIMS